MNRIEKTLIFLYAISCAVSNAAMNIMCAAIIMYVIGILFKIEIRNEFQSYWKSHKHFFYLLIALCGAIVVSLISSDIQKIIPDIFYLRDLKKLNMFILLIALGFLAVRNRKTFYQAIVAWLLILAVESLYATLQSYFGFDLIRGERGVLHTSFDPSIYHAGGFFNHYLTYASIAILAVPMVFPLFSKKIAFPLCAILSLGVYYSYSRSAWIGLVVVFLLLGIYFLKTWRRRLTFAIFLLLSVVAILFTAPHVLKRFTHFSDVQRHLIWKANINMFLDHPVFGVGFLKNEALSGQYVHQLSSDPDAFVGHAHNNFLTFLAGTGIIGASIFLLLWFYIFWKSINHPKIPTLAFPLIAMAGFHVIGMTQMNFFDSEVSFNLILVWAFWLMRMKEIKGAT